MFFTREDILKIERELSKLGIKDHQFKDAKLPLDNKDLIVVTQQGKNTKLDIGNFLTQVSRADEEDITLSKDNTLKFKDLLTSEQFVSTNVIILRRNEVDNAGFTKNILTQDMIDKPDTIYIIKYDFEIPPMLELEIPEGCTLVFQGGHISGGTLKYNHTYIKGVYTFKDISIEGNPTKEAIGSTFGDGQQMFLFDMEEDRYMLCYYMDNAWIPVSDNIILEEIKNQISVINNQLTWKEL